MACRTIGSVAFALVVLAAPATSQETPRPPPADCPVMPARLEGTYTDKREISGMITQSYVNTVRVNWIKDEDDLPPLPGASVAPDGQLGSRAWREMHANERPGCPVTSYHLEGGTVNFKLETSGKGIGGPGECKGSTEQTFSAEVLKRYSALYIGERGYLITVAATDFMIPDTTVSGQCMTPGAVTPWSSPVNDNVIMLLDKRGEFTGGAVRGSFSGSAGYGWTHSGNWNFVAR